MTMDQLIEQLAIEMHNDVSCPTPFYQHNDYSKEAWRQQARIAIEFLRRHKDEILGYS